MRGWHFVSEQIAAANLRPVMDEEQIERLRQRLNEIHRWPSIYVFKFIMPNKPDKVQELKSKFNENVEFSTRLSEHGKYISITVREMMLDADSIFDRYRAASRIEGIISL